VAYAWLLISVQTFFSAAGSQRTPFHLLFANTMVLHHAFRYYTPLPSSCYRAATNALPFAFAVFPALLVILHRRSACAMPCSSTCTLCRISRIHLPHWSPFVSGCTFCLLIRPMVLPSAVCCHAATAVACHIPLVILRLPSMPFAVGFGWMDGTFIQNG
jgi:hypothetical protein